MISPTRQAFKDKTRRGNVIPVYAEVFADLETPVSAFLKLRRGSFNVLLESVERGTQLGRYSFLGRDPRMIFESKGRTVTLRRGAEVKRVETENPLAELEHLMDGFRPVPDPNLPPFTGGLVGYMGYDAVRLFEKIPDSGRDDLHVPDMYFLLLDTVVAFDNIRRRLTVIHNVMAESGDNLDLLYDQATGVVRQILSDLAAPLTDERASTLGIRLGSKIVSSFPKQDFLSAVERCRTYIREGDIIQAVLSQRLQTSFKGDPFDLYRALRVINPSPYMFHLEMEGLTLVGASPEVHVRAVEGDVTIRPIAGTRPRGRNATEDVRLERELLDDEKERAEHLMLVDLGRNDLGRVCRPGSVEVVDFMSVRRYSHVMHLESTVVGDLADGRTSLDALLACFPAGTLSGAPKVRAMEIIENLEVARRGVYGGVVGYLDFAGDLDTAIAIRTAVLKDSHVWVQAGAGIVADSDPASEDAECRAKAMAVLRAAAVAATISPPDA